MHLTILQWNITKESSPRQVVKYLLQQIKYSPCLICLQEVNPETKRYIIQQLKPTDSAYGLDLWANNKELSSTNRNTASLTMSFGCIIYKKQVIQKSIYCERHLLTETFLLNRKISVLNSLINSEKMNKQAESSQLIALSSYLKNNSVDFFTCEQSTNQSELTISDADKNNNTNCIRNNAYKLLFSDHKTHYLKSIIDTYQERYQKLPKYANSYEHYDYIHHAPNWKLITLAIQKTSEQPAMCHRPIVKGIFKAN